MNQAVTPQSVWNEYEAGRRYNQSAGLYETVELNENFYIGKQWEGVNAPDLDKPVINILQRAASYQIAQVVSDDISVNFTVPGGPGGEPLPELLAAEVDAVMERNNFKSLNREALRDAAVDGDAVMHIFAETLDAEQSGSPAARRSGSSEVRIKAELLQNTNVIFGNPHDRSVQSQPYIIIVQYLRADDVKDMLPRGADRSSVRPDTEGIYSVNADMPDDGGRVTLLTRFWKEDGSLRFYKCTKDAEVTPKTALSQRLYPIAYMSWNKIRNSYHGQAAITGMIPNQIFINKAYAMAMRHMQLSAFPKLFYDRVKISKWSNRVGEAVAVTGNPNDAIAGAFKMPDMSSQLFTLVDSVITHTRENMGATDAAIGSVRPDNASAIIAVQKASGAPLELQRLEFYRFSEDCVRVMLDVMRASYGIQIRLTPDKEEVAVDFSAIDADGLNLKIDVGEAAYWSELAQLTTMDGLYDRGLISPETYVEGLPGNYVRNRSRVIEDLKKRNGGADGLSGM